jgi:hypothetical protein
MLAGIPFRLTVPVGQQLFGQKRLYFSSPGALESTVWLPVKRDYQY